MIDINVKAFAEEGEVMEAVANHLGISYAESENLYVALGGMNGYSVNFSTRWPNADPFSVAVQEFMTAKGIDSLSVGYED